MRKAKTDTQEALRMAAVALRTALPYVQEWYEGGNVHARTDLPRLRRALKRVEEEIGAEAPKARCWRCRERRECRKVRVKLGGSYNRAPHIRPVFVCWSCAEEVVRSAGLGQITHMRVVISSAAHAWKIEREEGLT